MQKFFKDIFKIAVKNASTCTFSYSLDFVFLKLNDVHM